MTKYHIADEVELDKWDSFIEKHPHGNIFQSRHMYEVYRNTKNYEPIKLFALDITTHEICGVMTGIIITEIGGLIRKFTTHGVTQGGPLIKPGLEKILVPLLIEEFDRRCKKKAIYSEIRNLWDTKNIADYLPGYVYEEHLNYLINLKISENELWRNIHHSKRKNINRAGKEGIRVAEADNTQEVGYFYELLKETYHHARIPLAHISLFESAYQILTKQNLAKILLAIKEGKYVGARMILLYKDNIYDWYAGSLINYLPLRPNDILVWNTLRYGIKHRYSSFDFGGAGNPNIDYGPRLFKKSFGGQEVNYGRYKRVYSPIINLITTLGFKVYQRVFFINM